jgi:hypothetical protein
LMSLPGYVIQPIWGFLHLSLKDTPVSDLWRKVSLVSGTVKASNFRPHVNFGLFPPRRIYYHRNASYRKIKKNESFRNNEKV